MEIDVLRRGGGRLPLWTWTLLLGVGIGLAQVCAAAGMAGIFASMSDRQPALEGHLQDAANCLGEGLDGLVHVNTDERRCGPDVRAIADAENADRATLYRDMAPLLGVGPDEVGRQRAARYLEGYPRGVLREVRISANETTWWDGYPPDPRKTAISRVLTLYGAAIRARADPASAVVRDGLQQYEALGVVGSTEGADGSTWYQVTEDYVPKVKPRGWSPTVSGWVSGADVVPWRRALVMSFTNPYNRPASLFFDPPDALLGLIANDPETRARRLDDFRAALGRGSAPGSGVVAMEPSVNPDIEQLIMYPVLDYYERAGKDDIRIDRRSARLLQVAARTRPGGDDGGGVGGIGVDGPIAIDIVFVMDTTNSMQPYLADVLSAARRFAADNRELDLRFGFVGYQDRGRGFDYATKAFTTAPQSLDAFTETLQGVKARPVAVAGDDYPELVFDGINTALDQTRWRDRAIRVLFLVGDAPGKESDAMTLKRVWDKAQIDNVRIFAFHIPETRSRAYDAQARKQYQELSTYYSGPEGSAQRQSYLSSLQGADVAFEQLVLSRFQDAHASAEAVSRYQRGEIDSLPRVAPGSLSELIFQQATLMLADRSLPQEQIIAWVADKVLEDPGRFALEPKVLLNETELDELAARVAELKEIGEQALRGDGTTLDFFELVDRNTRMTMVDPTAVSFRDAFKVPLGIDRLPYDSDIMAMTRDEFRNPDRVRDFVRRMTDKLAYYEELRRNRGNRDVWKRLSTGAAEPVVGVLLSRLP